MSCEELKIIDASSLPVGKLISMIARAHTIYLNQNLKDYDITAAQLHLMFEISHQKEINQEKIAERSNINKGSVARSIKKLEDKGLIERHIDSENRRQNKISLTHKGNDILNESIDILNAWENEVVENINIETDLFKNVLKEIVIKTIELNERRLD